MVPNAHISWAVALDDWRKQDAAQFGRRAFAQLGRGFVMVEPNVSKFVYVTRLIDAPIQLVDEIVHYMPNSEAVLVYEDRAEPGVLIVRRIRIDVFQ